MDWLGILVWICWLLQDVQGSVFKRYSNVRVNPNFGHSWTNAGGACSVAECSNLCLATSNCKGFYQASNKACQLIIADHFSAFFLNSGGSDDIYLMESVWSSNGNLKFDAHKYQYCASNGPESNPPTFRMQGQGC